ncbi:MAG: transglutaminase-like domain-containing protein, partial [Thermoleophilia bacterium]|nr:transglutaminase-like domain-containing protein [Thermoleophilia bacterium]
LPAAIGQAAVLLALLTIEWAGLVAASSPGRLVLLVALGVAPALAALSPRAPRLLALLTTLACAAAAVLIATRPDLGALLARDGEAWRDLAGVLPDGLRALNDTTLPAPADADPALFAVLDLALWVIAACVAWLTIAARNALAGVVAVGVALAYRWTVVSPSRPLLEGALALAAVLAVLMLGARTGSGRPAWGGRALRAGVVGVLVVGVAVAAAAPARDAGGWVDWRSWDLTPERNGGPATAIDLLQRYGQLQWPEVPAVVMRVKADRALPMRATAFEYFDGRSFEPGTRGPSALPLRRGDRVELDGVGSDPDAEVIRQEVRLVGATTPFVLAGWRMVAAEGPFPPAVSQIQDRLEVSPPLARGTRYRTEVRISEPSPRELLRGRAYDSGRISPVLTQVTAGFAGPVVTVPVWGTPGERPVAADFGPYAAVYELSERIVGDVASPYAAVNRIETYLRDRYAYDEQPPYPAAGVPPLADFLLTTRRGFCQHFAGSMALMLRMQGIPARVAVGFTAGRYDTGTDAFEIWDRDAHAWVEVLLPGQGWLPFDPTPGRFAANQASVSSPDYAPREIDVDLGGLARLSVRPPEIPAPPREAPEPPPEPGSPAPAGGSPWWWWIAALGAALLLIPLIPAAWRAVRRAARRRRGGERERVLGALHELEDLAARLGVPPDPTATATERAEDLRRVLGVDAGRLYLTAATARFARRQPPPGTAAAAWRDLAAVRRAARRAVPRRRRLAAMVLPSSRRRATVGA